MLQVIETGLEAEGEAGRALKTLIIRTDIGLKPFRHLGHQPKL